MRAVFRGAGLRAFTKAGRQIIPNGRQGQVAKGTGARDGITLLPGRERKSLHVLEGLLIFQTDLVDQLCVDNVALL